MNGMYRMGGLAAGLVVGLLAWAPAGQAQPARDNRDMTPAWTLQAQSVATELGLNDEQKQKLVDAYVASRTSYASAVEQATGEGRERFEAMMKAADAERTKMKDALAGSLSEEQIGKAMAPLGSYGRQTDRMVAAIQDMKLETEAQQKALVLINAYSADVNAMREKATSREDWQGMRETMQAAKATLDKGLAGVLSEAQMTTWNEATAWRGREGGAGGGGGRGNRDAEGSQGGAGAQGGGAQ